MKSSFKHKLLFFLILLTLPSSTMGAVPAQAAPAGLSDADWAQISALLPSQQAYLKASNTEASDLFGYTIAVDGDTVVVGAYQEDSNATGVNGNQGDNSATNSGAVYVFTRSGTTWTQQAYLKASNTAANDRFGTSVAISGNTVVVGANGEESNATGVNGNQSDNSASSSGAAYVFTRNGTTWSQQAYLKASNTGAGDYFGNSVAVSGDTVVVGAWQEDSNATGVNGNQSDNSALDSGAAYIFTRSGTTWSQQAYLKASNTEAGDWFGILVAISGDTVVVGAPVEGSNGTGVNGNQSNNSAPISGAAYVFTRSDTTWSQQAYLKASNTEADDWFGISVAIAGDTVVVGANGEDSNATGVNGDGSDNSASSSGAAYVFTRSGTDWSQKVYLKASNTEASDHFGTSVAIAGDTVVVGAIGEDSNSTGVNSNQSDNSASASGAAYVFTRSGTDWTQQAYLKAYNTGSYDWFGNSVDIAGDTVVVAAFVESSNATGVNGDGSDNSAPSSGAVYAFAAPTYTVSYNANGATSGTAPGDQSKTHDMDLTLATNSGVLVKTGYTFNGWNTQPDGLGTHYNAGGTYTANAAVTMYAEWSSNTYTVSYDANGATGGSAPSSQSKTHDVDLTLATNTGSLVKTGYTFNGWNTAADGNGTHYAAGGTYTANAAVTLYAEWTANQHTTLRAILYSTGSQDGWVLESSETSESGGTVDSTSTVLIVGDDASDRQYRSMLSFDTSSLPDTAVITQAVLSLRVNEVLGGGNPIKVFNYFMADMRTGSFGASSALAAQDFGFSPTVAVGPLGALNRGGWYYVDLKTGKSAVNTTGLTQVRLRFSIGDNDNGIANIIKIYSGNSTVKPQLSLWYYVP